MFIFGSKIRKITETRHKTEESKVEGNVVLLWEMCAGAVGSSGTRAASWQLTDGAATLTGQGVPTLAPTTVRTRRTRAEATRPPAAHVGFICHMYYVKNGNPNFLVDFERKITYLVSFERRTILVYECNNFELFQMKLVEQKLKLFYFCLNKN